MYILSIYIYFVLRKLDFDFGAVETQFFSDFFSYSEMSQKEKKNGGLISEALRRGSRRWCACVCVTLVYQNVAEQNILIYTIYLVFAFLCFFSSNDRGWKSIYTFSL